jgi:hypothetical protein
MSQTIKLSISENKGQEAVFLTVSIVTFLNSMPIGS